MTRILIIEDNESIRKGIAQTLQCLDYEVIEAENGSLGIREAKLNVPDLIICDIMMPEVDGYEVYTALRQDSETLAIPFIFLTAKADKSDIRKGMNLGADDYLTKPFTTSELREAIAARLNKQHAVITPYITEMKLATEQLSNLAYRDALTGLPNRILLRHKLQQALTQAKISNQAIAVICLDLHRFKTINTTWGYSTGDSLLKAVGDRLTEIAGEPNIVARMNGDIFSLVLTKIQDQQDVEAKVQKILDGLTKPYYLDQQQISIQVSLGAAVYPQDAGTVGELFSHAEMAMGYAKQLDKGGYRFYQAEMGARSEARRILEEELSHALERSEFQVYYQPQVSLVTGRIIGFEALLRWHNEKLKQVSPAEFIPVAEDTGLIVSIGEWVLKTVCAQAKAWQSLNSFPLRAAINLSACQLKQKNILEVIAQTLDATQLEPNLLDLELTETTLMDDVEFAITTLQALKVMGIQVAIDDFGTGYSSLSYLKRFPIDILKIDRSFISESLSDANSMVIIKTIIAMGQGLKVKVIAEGVETQEQLDFLRKQGCYAMQGFLFSPALLASEFEALLVEQKRLQLG